MHETIESFEPQQFDALRSVRKESDSAMGLLDRENSLKVTLISLHGLIRAKNPELGFDADTGGQIQYVLELAKELAKQPQVREVEVLTRQVIDQRVSAEYSVLEERISPNAKLVRIPFGPRRYLSKESLWPYIELFVDQTLVHFKRNGIPDIIHGHYADAGLAGAQLARLLHVPFIFTGHSLGRVKRQRLVEANRATKNSEKKYRFAKRFEAEETALETASMVVTSTNQEVVQQYELYDHYQPSTMEVIPPGVDLSRFSPPEGDVSETNIVKNINRFLIEPNKPCILTVARPDERKNLEKLVEVYGKSQQLQQSANLVMVMGTRENIRKLPKGQRQVLNNVMHLIDVYDLYGRIAYPKTHLPEDIPDLYRHAVNLRGVFINPALTEPFGLTLLEAGATGLPIVATHDGGPQDIIANCQNGLLVDPHDDAAIEKALLRVLEDHDNTGKPLWDSWSLAGIEGTRRHYSWENHARRYLRDLNDILEHEDRPALVQSPRARRIPEFDRILITDLDNTLTGDPDALVDLIEILEENDHIGFGISTGRRLDSAQRLIDELGLPKPDLLDTDNGTQLHYGPRMLADLSWRKQIDYAWAPEAVREILKEEDGFFLQPDENQSEFKLSYLVDPQRVKSVSPIRRILRAAGVRAKAVLSLGTYLDIIPVRGGSDMTLRHLLWKWGFSPEKVLVAGDSGNDAGMLLGRTLGVVVANHSPELKRLKNRPRIYFAQSEHARGIIEGIHYYNFLSDITIPNEQIDQRQ